LPANYYSDISKFLYLYRNNLISAYEFLELLLPIKHRLSFQVFKELKKILKSRMMSRRN